MPELIDAASLNLAQQYVAMRDAPRERMSTGVYPNCVKALEEYSSLLLWLTANPSYAQLHGTITAQVAPCIVQLQTAMQSITTIMESIEQASPGTFGIQLPVVEEQPE